MNPAPFTLKSLLICDDIRRENNGKEILIGVYSGAIAIAAADPNGPVLLPSLCFRVEGHAIALGASEIRISLIDPAGTELSEQTITFNVRALEDALVFSARLSPMVFAAPGIYRVRCRMAGWEQVVGSFEVRFRPMQ